MIDSAVVKSAVSISSGKIAGSRGTGTGGIPVVGVCSVSTACVVKGAVGVETARTDGIPAVGACSNSTAWGVKGAGVDTAFGVLRAFLAASFSKRLIREVCGGG